MGEIESWKVKHSTGELTFLDWPQSIFLLPLNRNAENGVENSPACLHVCISGSPEGGEGGRRGKGILEI